MKKIVINEVSYEVVKENGDAIDVDLLSEKITDYFNDFDYIVGDWAYGKVRLKGFYESDNKKCNKVFLLNVLAWYPAYVARPRVMVERVWYYEKA
jgi:uncharacterized protein YutD